LAPIFTPARSVAEAEVDANFSQQTFEDVQVHTYTAEETKEAFDVARNSIELLSTVLSSSPQQDALQVTGFYVTFCQNQILGFCITYHSIWMEEILITLHTDIIV
jgi:hypothetical protein